MEVHFAHVGNVEYAHVVAHGVVLGFDAFVADGHVVAGEGRHQSAQCSVMRM